MGARNRGGIGLSYRPARLHRLAEFIPWNQFRGPINILKDGLWFCWCSCPKTGLSAVVSYLEVLLGGLCAGPGVEGDEANWRGRLPVLAGHLEQRALVPLQNPPNNHSINQLIKPAEKWKGPIRLRALAINEIGFPFTTISELYVHCTTRKNI